MRQGGCDRREEVQVLSCGAFGHGNTGCVLWGNAITRGQWCVCDRGQSGCGTRLGHSQREFLEKLQNRGRGATRPGSWEAPETVVLRCGRPSPWGCVQEAPAPAC